MVANQHPFDRLMVARVRAGFETAKEFATSYGIPQSTYALHESGKRALRPKVAERYAKLLGNCTPSWLLYGMGEVATRNPNLNINPDRFDDTRKSHLEIVEAFTAVNDLMLEFLPESEKRFSSFGYTQLPTPDESVYRYSAVLSLNFVLETAEMKQADYAPGTLLEESIARFRSYQELQVKAMQSLADLAEAINEEAIRPKVVADRIVQQAATPTSANKTDTLSNQNDETQIPD